MRRSNYETPDMIIISLSGDDIIRTSGGLVEGQPDGEGSEEWGSMNIPR